MIQRLKLSTKIIVTLAPVFILGVLISIFLDYNFQKQTLLKQAQESAEIQSNIIKASLLNMMVTNQRVNDAFLHSIQNSAGVEDLSVLFHYDSLHLLPTYLNAERTERLKQREQSVMSGKNLFSNSMYTTEQPQIVVQCNLSEHHSYRLDSSEAQPFYLPSCEYLTIVMPFKADETCRQCHDVPAKATLGAAYIEIGLDKTAAALRMNAFRSIAIFLVFSVFALLIGFFIYTKYIAKPVHQLVVAAEVLGTGDLNHNIKAGYDEDEFGRLATSFDQMRQRLKEVQETLLQKERLSTLGQMASSIIHDFRNPMTTISFSLDVLRNSRNVSPERQQMLYENISSCIKRMNLMTQELLEYSRGEIKLDLNNHRIKEFVTHVVKAVETPLQEKNIRLELQERCEDCNAIFDKERLSRAFINIINNAEDAMAKGGTLKLETIRENGTIVFQITDTGGGIPEEIRDKLFDPFITHGKKQGTGLGLAITKKIIEEHKGNITFTSSEGVGTTFIIKIPA